MPICENVFSGNSINSLAALEYEQSAYWALAAEPPGCPKLLHGLDDGRVKRVRGAIYAITDEHYPPPYASGFTNIVFEAKGYDEIGSFRLPKAAELTVGETTLLGSSIEFPPKLSGSLSLRIGGLRCRIGLCRCRTWRRTGSSRLRKCKPPPQAMATLCRHGSRLRRRGRFGWLKRLKRRGSGRWLGL